MIMRVILDTNILIAALITEGTPPDRLYSAWREGRFTLLSCDQQIAEIREVTRRHGVRLRIRPTETGRMVNSIRALSTMVSPLPHVDAGPDPNDNFLLALARAGEADYLVTGERRDLLDLGRFDATPIVTARALLSALDGTQE